MKMVIEDLIKELTLAQNVIDNYEQRVKVAMIAMLEELKTEIGKTAEEEENYDVKWALGLLLAKKIIQEKIDALKGE